MPRDSRKTRKAIVDAAGRLFYGEGIRAVSVDSVAEKAGVTKKTLYYHFASKDELIAAYLKAQDQPALDLYRRWYAEADGTIAERVKSLFERFAEAASSPRWKGCGFLRTTAELAAFPGHPAVVAGARHKKRFEAWLAEIMEDAAVSEPEAVARQVVVLLDGAATIMLIHRDADYVRSAASLAEALVRDSARRP